jgi:hypothetical protein
MISLLFIHVLFCRQPVRLVYSFSRGASVQTVVKFDVLHDVVVAAVCASATILVVHIIQQIILYVYISTIKHLSVRVFSISLAHKEPHEKYNR